MYDDNEATMSIFNNADESKNSNEMNPLLVIEDLCRIFNVKKGTIFSWVNQGKIPKPIKISHRMARWRHDDIKKAYDKVVGDVSNR
jgi:predicted DNA-binding transcriptional regulator AlpA